MRRISIGSATFVILFAFAAESADAFYIAQLGRWLTRDSDQYIDGYNLYQYVRSQPLTNIDPSGRWPECLSPPCRIISYPSSDKSCVDRANEAESIYFPGVADPFGGGFRHCVAACCLKKRYGGIIAGVGIGLHDVYTEDPNTENSQGDMAGERAGQCVADTPQSCEAGCKDAMTNPSSPCKKTPKPPNPSFCPNQDKFVWP
jgi:hypothetical protein